jgi:ABC-type polysaccharide/polyol phosphate transport system ATPase subunit
MKPDRGTIRTKGSIAPILALGIGFHDDLTVEENAEVYGVILGLARSDVRKLVEPILQFAGLEKFQDMKLKHLSSGMKVRLGFSIAIQTAPDIFLIDEALAVGDMEFQQKCLEKFRDFKKDGKSIVLVSHNTELIGNYCEKGLYLLNGETRVFGTSGEATRQYIDDISVASQSHAKV